MGIGIGFVSPKGVVIAQVGQMGLVKSGFVNGGGLARRGKDGALGDWI